MRIGARLARLIIKIVTFSNFPLTALLIFAAKTLTNALGKLQIRTYIFDTLSEGRGFVCNHYIVTLIKFNTSRVEFEMNLLSVRYLEMLAGRKHPPGAAILAADCSPGRGRCGLPEQTNLTSTKIIF